MPRSLRALVRGWLVRIKHWPDRARHVRRRAAAEALLRSWPVEGTIVIICYGNICRSPYAEAVLKRHLGGGSPETPVISAGFFGPDRTAPDVAIESAEGRGVDLTGHRSQLAAAVKPDRWGLAVVMEPRQVDELAGELGWLPRTVVLGDLDPEPITKRSILDPYGKDRATFDEVYARIDRCIARLAAAMMRDGR